MSETLVRTVEEMPVHTRRAGFDPVPELAAADAVSRVRTPLGTDAWMLTRYADIRAVLADPGRFSNEGVPNPVVRGLDDAEMARLQAGNLLAHDPPAHSRLRRILAPEFTLRRMRVLEPRIQQIVDDQLDALERAGAPADLVQAFALPVPSLVICELLGVPYADRAGFQGRTNRLLDLSIPMEDRIALRDQSRDYMAGLVTRAQVEPGEDLLGMLVREHGTDLTTDELIGIANLLLIAGHETTANMLGLGTLALLRHPDQLEMVRDGEQSAVETAVEELLRWLSIVHSGTMKRTTTDVELGGLRIPAGDIVLCALSAGNRDGAFRADPERLDIRRGSMTHLAFGHGIHHCLGAPLARMELRIAFPALFRRFPGLREVPGGAEFRSFHVIFGLTKLPVTW
jgi:cytochrome P450